MMSSSSDTSFSSSETARIIEMYRRCHNLCVRTFSGELVSALQNFVTKRLILVEEKRRAGALARAVECPHETLMLGHGPAFLSASTGASGILTLAACTTSEGVCTFPLLDGLIHQYDVDIGNILGQMHTATEQYRDGYRTMKELISHTVVGAESASRSPAARGLATGDASHRVASPFLASSLRRLLMVCSDLLVWMQGVTGALRKSLPAATPQESAVEIVVAGLPWWSADPQPIDGEKAWSAATQSILEDEDVLLLAAQ